MMEFLTVFAAAFAAENLLFARAFDAYGLRNLKEDPKKILQFGALTTLILVIACPFAYGVNRLLYGTAIYNYVNGLAHLLILAALYAGAYLLMKQYLPKIFEQIGKYLPFAAFNCATLGSLLLTAKDVEIDNLSKAFAYHCGAGAGFTLALLLLWSLRQRMNGANVPKSFRGFPLEMITVGLIALALVGLTGTQLPA